MDAMGRTVLRISWLRDHDDVGGELSGQGDNAEVMAKQREESPGLGARARHGPEPA
jgi:hypothetical protein